MEFPLERRQLRSQHYEKEVLDTSYEFTKRLHKELGTLVRAAVLFGSATKKDEPHDIDILVIIDDIQLNFNQELQAAYRVIVENCIKATSTRLHITTLRFSNFWEYVRTSDPVIVNVLRTGIALIDTGFFSPMQLLLQQGRIRPTAESIWAYYMRAPQMILSSKWKMMLAVVDLYWAAIDSAHAALMSVGVVPPSPEHVPELLREKFVQKGLMDAKYPRILSHLYDLQKEVVHHEMDRISGAKYDRLFDDTNDFIAKMRIFIE